MAVVHLIKKPRTPRAPGLALCGKKFLLPVVGASDMSEVTCQRCLAKAGSEEVKQLLVQRSKDDIAKLNAYIGKQVRRYRRENKLSQAKLGALLGRTQTWASSLELGAYNIDLPLLAALENVLNRPIESFLPKRRGGRFVVGD